MCLLDIKSRFLPNDEGFGREGAPIFSSTGFAPLARRVTLCLADEKNG